MAQRKTGKNGNLNCRLAYDLLEAADEAARREGLTLNMQVKRTHYVQRLLIPDLIKKGLWPWKPEYKNAPLQVKAA